MTGVAGESSGHRLQAGSYLKKWKGERVWWSAVLAAWWLPFLWRLTPVWSSAIEQAHGWVVPFFALYFAGERMRWMPASRRLTGAARGIAWVAAMAAVAGLPLALTILEANPAWPLAQWAGFACVATAVLLLVALSDGGRRAAHFVFPVLFVATALSWPSAVTTRLVAGLVGMNAEIAATVVSAAGYPAVVSGNVIEVASGLVGIDEACSGLRSLQAVWMAAWFFGELFLLKGTRRIALAVGAMALAIGGNAVRTTALTWVAAADSPAASARWHDRAGEIELLATLVAVAALAGWFARSGARRPKPTSETRAPAGGLVKAMLAAGVLAAAVPVAWFGWHEATAPGERWQWEMTAADASWRDHAVPEAAREMLRPTAIEAKVREENAEGARSFALLVRWDGDVAAAVNSESHDPSICLPAAGMEVRIEEPVEVTIDGKRVVFTTGLFTAEGRWQHVFYCHWDAWLGGARTGERANLSNVPAWRLERVRLGRRRGDAAYVAFVVPLADATSAEAWLGEWAPRLLRRR